MIRLNSSCPNEINHVLDCKWPARPKLYCKTAFNTMDNGIVKRTVFANCYQGLSIQKGQEMMMNNVSYFTVTNS